MQEHETSNITKSNSPVAKVKSDKPLVERLNWRGVLFLTLTPIASLILIPLYIYHFGFQWGQMALLGIFYVISNMAITCGYHRYFAHKSYEVHPVLKFIYVFFGSGAFQGSILEWSTDHRRHHSKVDTDMDPYSIKKGFWHAHFWWMFFKDEHATTNWPKDLASSKLILNQHKYYGFWSTGVGFLLPAIVGYISGVGFIAGFLFGGLLRTVLSQHSTFFVNSLAHTLGSQPYSNKHSAKDSLIVAILTFGEGYHNYHHEFQSDYRAAVKWYQWDPSKWFIRFLWTMGLVTKVKKFSDSDILMAKLELQSQQLAVQGKWNERLQGMHKKVEDAQRHMKQLMAEYQRLKMQKTEEYKERYQTLKTDVKLAQLEFQAHYRQCLYYAKALKNQRARV